MGGTRVAEMTHMESDERKRLIAHSAKKEIEGCWRNDSLKEAVTVVRLKLSLEERKTDFRDAAY